MAKRQGMVKRRWAAVAVVLGGVGEGRRTTGLRATTVRPVSRPVARKVSFDWVGYKCVTACFGMRVHHSCSLGEHGNATWGAQMHGVSSAIAPLTCNYDKGIGHSCAASAVLVPLLLAVGCKFVRCMLV